MKNMKKKIVVVALIVAIFTMSIASATIAYFTDTSTKTNTFTVGGVKIDLDDEATTKQYTNLYPGQAVAMNPTIKNNSQDPVYVAGIVTLSCANHYVTDLLTVEAEDDKILMSDFLTGGALAEASGYSVKMVETDRSTITVYIIAENALASGAEIALFGDMNIPAKWDHAQMAYIEDLTITVNAYATQSVGFDNGSDAIEAAFGGGADSSYDVFASYFATTATGTTEEANP